MIPSPAGSQAAAPLERERTGIDRTVGAQQDRRARDGRRTVEIEPVEQELGNRGVVARNPLDESGALHDRFDRSGVDDLEQCRDVDVLRRQPATGTLSEFAMISTPVPPR